LINGFLQSMGWGPILRTLSVTLAPTQRQRIAGAFGASYVVGNTITWLLTALILSTGQWRLIFLIPPLFMLGIGIVWYLLSVPAAPSAETRSSLTLPTIRALSGELWHILITALVAGALINGALIYAPTYIAQTLPLDQAALTSIIFPIFGLLGTVWLSAWILEHVGGSALRSLIILLVLSAVTRALAFFLPPSTLAAVILLAAMGITSYALTNILLTAIPLTTNSHFGTSVVAGLMDATHSIGGAIGSTMVGLLLARGSWSLVFGMWTILPLIAVGMIALAARFQSIHRFNQKEDFV
jgi:sugar phosphate permease